MCRASLFLLTLLLCQPLCFAQNPGTVTIQQTPLPVIINGKQGAQQQTQTAPQQSSEPTDPPESIIAFAPESLQLRWSQSRWQLLAGDVLLKDFGRQEALARRTLLLLRELRINQYGTVGQPKPVLEYWLTDGLAPQGNPTALRAVPLDQGSLRADKLYGQWCVHDVYQMLLQFGNDEDSAHQAVAILKKHRFTQVGSLGTFPPTLFFLTRRGDSLLPARAQIAGAPALHSTGAVRSTMAPYFDVRPQQTQLLTGSSGQSSPQRPGTEP